MFFFVCLFFSVQQIHVDNLMVSDIGGVKMNSTLPALN